MLIKVGSVKKTEAVLVAREMRRDPVQDDTDTVLVERINEEHEILGRPVAARGRKVPEGFITPGSVERMFHHGKKLHVSEPQASHIFG